MTALITKKLESYKTADELFEVIASVEFVLITVQPSPIEIAPPLILINVAVAVAPPDKFAKLINVGAEDELEIYL